MITTSFLVGKQMNDEQKLYMWMVDKRDALERKYPIYIKDGVTKYDHDVHSRRLNALIKDLNQFVRDEWWCGWLFWWWRGGNFYVTREKKPIWDDRRIMTVTVHVEHEEHVAQVKELLKRFRTDEWFDVEVEVGGDLFNMVSMVGNVENSQLHNF